MVLQQTLSNQNLNNNKKERQLILASVRNNNCKKKNSIYICTVVTSNKPFLFKWKIQFNMLNNFALLYIITVI